MSLGGNIGWRGLAQRAQCEALIKRPLKIGNALGPILLCPRIILWPAILMATERSVALSSAALARLRQRVPSKYEHVVLWHLAHSLPPGGAVVVISDRAAEVGIAPPNFNVALRELCKAGFLLRGAKLGRSWHYRLNPALVRIIQ